MGKQPPFLDHVADAEPELPARARLHRAAPDRDATAVGSEAVLPAYLVGMALAPTFQSDPELPHRMRSIAFAVLTPFYFLKAGSLVEAKTLVNMFAER